MEAVPRLAELGTVVTNDEFQKENAASSYTGVLYVYTAGLNRPSGCLFFFWLVGAAFCRENSLPCSRTCCKRRWPRNTNQSTLPCESSANVSLRMTRVATVTLLAAVSMPNINVAFAAASVGASQRTPTPWLTSSMATKTKTKAKGGYSPSLVEVRHSLVSPMVFGRDSSVENCCSGASDRVDHRSPLAQCC